MWHNGNYHSNCKLHFKFKIKELEQKTIYLKWDKTYVLTNATCFCFYTSYNQDVQKDKDSIHNMHRLKIKFLFIRKQTLIISFTWYIYSWLMRGAVFGLLQKSFLITSYEQETEIKYWTLKET
jgi:hypothetical protein